MALRVETSELDGLQEDAGRWPSAGERGNCSHCGSTRPARALLYGGTIVFSCGVGYWMGQAYLQPPPSIAAVQDERFPGFHDERLVNFHAAALSDPAGYKEYTEALQACVWSEEGTPLSVHSRFYQQGGVFRPTKFERGDPGAWPSWPSAATYWPNDEFEKRYPNASLRSSSFPEAPFENSIDPPVQTCIIGDYHVTRVGPVALRAYESFTVHMLPASPLGRDTFLTESVDVPRDTAARVLPYPPVHVHHSQGLQTRMIPSRERQPEFADFAPLTAWWSADDSRFNLAEWQVSEFPISLPDFICEVEIAADPYSCLYLRIPPGFGMLHRAASQFWADSHVEHVGGGGALDATIILMLEYGRRYVNVGGARPALKLVSPVVFMLKYMNGSQLDDVYEVPPHTSSSLTWREFVLPASGEVVASFFHTHSGLATETWILAAAASDVLPAGLGDPANSAARQAVPRGPALPVEDVPALQVQILRTVALVEGAQVLCRYGSRFNHSTTHPHPVGSIRNGSGCDGWHFRRGDRLTQLTFAEANTSPTAYPMHSALSTLVHFEGYDLYL